MTNRILPCPGADDPAERCPRHPKDCTCWKVDREQSRSAPPVSNLNGSDETLRLAVAAVLEADTEFRSNLPKDWEGDPLSDELDGLRRIFEASSAPVSNVVPVGTQFRTRIKGVERWSGWRDGPPNPVRFAQGYVEVETRTIYTATPVLKLDGMP